MIEGSASKVPELAIIPLRFAEAARLASELQELVAHAAVGGEDPEIDILADPRDNSLLVMAAPEHLERIRELATKLDVQPD